jgi:hypothetical protein
MWTRQAAAACWQAGTGNERDGEDEEIQREEMRE